MTVDPACRGGTAPPGTGRAAGWSQWAHRRGLERRLHDGAALRISALTLRLGLVRCRLPGDDAELHRAVDGVQDELHAVLQELRGIAAELYPPLLDEAGLGPALREEADRRGAAVTIDVPDDRFGPSAEGAAYFAVVPCLAVAAPAGAGRVTVTARRVGDVLQVRVTGTDARHVVAFREGTGPLGGNVEVASGESAAGESATREAPGGERPGGTTITARFPCG